MTAARRWAREDQIALIGDVVDRTHEEVK